VCKFLQLNIKIIHDLALQLVKVIVIKRRTREKYLYKKIF